MNLALLLTEIGLYLTLTHVSVILTDNCFYLFQQLHQLRKSDFPKLKILSVSLKMEQHVMLLNYFKMYGDKSDFSI